MKKIIIAAILGTACVGGGVATGVVANTPEYVLSNALSNAVEEFIEREDISNLVDVFEQGSIDFSYEADYNFEAGGKVYFGLKDYKLFVENAYVEDGTSTDGISTSANLYLSDEMIYVENDEYLDGAYGIKLKKIAKQFENSIFYEDSDYSFPEEVSEMLVDILEYYEDDFKDLEKDLTKLYKDYTKKLGKLIKEYGEFESENKKVSLNTGKSEKRVVTLELDEKAIASILEELMEYIIDDDKLEDLIITHVSCFDELISKHYGESFDADDIYDELINSLEAVANRAKDIKRSDIEIKLNVVTPKLSAKLLKVELEAEVNGFDHEIAIDFGENGVKKSKNIDLLIDNDKVGSYLIKENSKNKLSLKLASFDEEDEEEEIGIEFILDKEKGKFVLSYLEERFETYTIKGNAELNKNTISFDSISAVKYVSDGRTYKEVELLENIDISFSISTKDKMPKPNKDFINILEMSEDDVYDLINDLE